MANRGDKIEVWKSKNDDKFYFHKRASNGKIAAPSQGYSTNSNARRAAKRLFPYLLIVNLDKVK